MLLLLCSCFLSVCFSESYLDVKVRQKDVIDVDDLQLLTKDGNVAGILTMVNGS